MVMLAALVVLTITGCRFFEDEGQKKVRHFLKDPQAAEFRNARAVVEANSYNSNAHETFCGEVNFKNSYGAFTGFKKYVVKDLMVVIEDGSVALYDVTDDPSAKPTDPALRELKISLAKVGLTNLISAANVKNMQQQNKEQSLRIARLRGKEIDENEVVDTGKIFTAFDIAWEENCK